ncbi:universal stress protein [Sutterella sp.]|uniref:universal stress protein n=1 Tax=Sutterella sp. TaxID=1981025 RepID=UPI0025D4E7EC|nr:universal stress protein [uncultured Sutterella sp.]
MYKRILIPTDGSERSLKAVEGAARFAKPLGATLVIMTVVEPYSYTNLAEYRPESIEQYDERVTAEAEERLAEAKKIADAAGVEDKTVMVKSFSPAEAIIEQAEKNGCDIIFMASHGRKGIAAVLLGSETQKVLTHSRFPVMVYR